jgi:large subunit ribosomal protein L31
MAKSVKYTYHNNATATCANCKSIYTLGMTVDKLSIEICGNCHPFYTGQETLVDTAGRIEKFQARLAKVGENTSKQPKEKARKSKQSLADLN